MEEKSLLTFQIVFLFEGEEFFYSDEKNSARKRRFLFESEDFCSKVKISVRKHMKEKSLPVWEEETFLNEREVFSPLYVREEPWKFT